MKIWKDSLSGIELHFPHTLCMYTRKIIQKDARWFNEQIEFHRSRIQIRATKNKCCERWGVRDLRSSSLTRVSIRSGGPVLVRQSEKGVVHWYSWESLEQRYVQAGGAPRSACGSRSRRRARGRERQTCTGRTSRVRVRSARAVVLARTNSKWPGHRSLQTRSSP